MDKKFFDTLKTIDSSEVATTLANHIRGNEDLNEYHIKSIAIAYVLYQAQINRGVNIDSLESFDETTYISEEIKRIVYRYAESVWSVITLNKDKFSTEQLLAYILFNNELEDFRNSECSTPTGISRLVCEILNIQDNDTVLELCSGKGTFIVEEYAYNQKAEFTGVELYFVANDIATIRASLLGENVSLILRDALEYRSDKKADKLFSNYPFMLKAPSMTEHKENIQRTLGMSREVVQRASSDWIFNATLIEQMSDEGKAVAIMTNGSTWNSTDKNIRQFFIENGYIEAVIALPTKLFNSFMIATTLIVFSKNNKTIKMIDAREICSKERRNNVLTEESIKEIMALFKVDGEKSITKSIHEFADNDYILNATRYLEILPGIENGVEFETVIKNITRGAQLKASDLDDMKSKEPTPYQYLMLANINDGIISLDEEQYLSEISGNLLKYCVKNNSIVLSKIGMPLFKSAVAKVGDNQILLANGNLFVIEIDESKANPFYIQAFFASEAGVSAFRSIYTGGAIPTISLDKLRKMIVPLPSIEEQNAIGNKYAASMDEVILLRRKLEKATTRMKHIYDEEM